MLCFDRRIDKEEFNQRWAKIKQHIQSRLNSETTSAETYLCQLDFMLLKHRLKKRFQLLLPLEQTLLPRLTELEELLTSQVELKVLAQRLESFNLLLETT